MTWREIALVVVALLLMALFPVALLAIAPERPPCPPGQRYHRHGTAMTRRFVCEPIPSTNAR